MLVKRLGVTEYDVHMPFIGNPVQNGDRVILPLQQHLGAPATPLVDKGSRVRKGQLIADVAEGKMGAAIHASIDGVVREISHAITIDAQ
jgi:Na+-translocating ferredoxin:NAD+ oxidoreductase RnfC subunit